MLIYEHLIVNLIPIVNSILGSMKDSSILLQDSKDLTEKERALDKRINEIKQQNKAIVMRGREIEKDKKLYG